MKILATIWNSPTATTWASFAAKGLNLVVILPLVLNKFSTGEITLWYLFLTIMSFQVIADLGFGPTFIRVLAFAMGGANHIGDMREMPSTEAGTEPNRDLMSRIISTMSSIYVRLTLAVLVLLCTVGTWSLMKPVSFVENQEQAWIAWAVIVFCTSIGFFGGVFVNYLQGINQIAVYRRWDAITSIGAIISGFVVLYMYNNLLLLVIVSQVWVIINVARNIWLCKVTDDGRFFDGFIFGIDRNVWSSVFPSAWKSGLGLIMTYGLFQSSGIVFAQIGEVTNVASYLLSLRILQAIVSFTQAPFYSKIPFLARLMAEGNMKMLVAVARRGMVFSHWLYVSGFILVGATAKPVLTFIDSNAEFASPALWSLMGLAFFMERYGAMHIQLYSTTNHIIWHVANGVSGLIYLLVSFSLYPFIDVYAFPLGLLIGHIGFYCWYSARHSFQLLKVNYFQFEKRSAFIPFLTIITFIIIYNWRIV